MHMNVIALRELDDEQYVDQFRLAVSRSGEVREYIGDTCF